MDLASVASNARSVNPRGEIFWKSGHKKSTRSSCLIRVDTTRSSCYNRIEIGTRFSCLFVSYELDYELDFRIDN